METISNLVDRILDADDYVSVLRESKNYYIKTRDEFIAQLKKFADAFKKLGVDATLDVTDDAINFTVNRGYMNDPKSELLILNFEDGGKIECDTSKRFRAPGTTNANRLVDANQLLKVIDDYVYSLEREKKINNQNREDDDPRKEKDEKTKEEREDETFELDPSVVKVLDKLKTDGENLITKVKSVPEIEYNGKKYKPDGGKLYASTEKELVLCIDFPRDQEIDIYSMDVDGQRLRNLIQRNFKKNGFYGNVPQFRKDMDRTLYLYLPVGKLPVRKTTGSEARAILNYYDGNKIRFQPQDDV